MTTTIVIIFLIVYLGMILGGLPFLQLDRTGVALLGAIAMISFDAVTLEEAAEAVHLPTIILFFSFMVLSAQMRLGGFYGWVTRGLAALPHSPAGLLGAMMVIVGKHVALTAAGVLLMSRKLHSNKIGLVDWEIAGALHRLARREPCPRSAPGWSPKPWLTSPSSVWTCTNPDRFSSGLSCSRISSPTCPE